MSCSKPSDFYLAVDDRFDNDKGAFKVDSDNIPNGTYLFMVSSHFLDEKFKGKVHMELIVQDAEFKGSKIATSFSMLKKDGSQNKVAMRIYSEVCDQLIGKKPEEFYELLNTQAYLVYKKNVGEHGTFHNINAPYIPKNKKIITENDERSINDKKQASKADELADEDIPF